MIDGQGREIDYIRISVTDRCNYRCSYCMPPEGVPGLSHEEILSYEEILRLVSVFASLGIHNVKITGGEPLVRKNLTWLIRRIREIPGIQDVTLTTNGYLLAEQAKALKEAGISTVNVSLDTLNRERYRKICRVDGLDQALAGIRAAVKAGLEVRINTTVRAEEVKPEELLQRELLSERFLREDVLELVRFGAAENVTVRFIELMPVGLGSVSRISNDMVEGWIREVYPDLQRCERTGHGPAVYDRYRAAPEKNRREPQTGLQESINASGCMAEVGFISAVHHKFCSSCNRIRLTADGFLKPCLASAGAVDVKSAMRGGCRDEELKGLVKRAILAKPASHHFEQAGGKKTASDLAGEERDTRARGLQQEESGCEQRIMSQIGG